MLRKKRIIVNEEVELRKYAFVLSGVGVCTYLKNEQQTEKLNGCYKGLFKAS